MGVVCKGCGLEINERAPTCYRCGTIQAGAAPLVPRAAAADPNLKFLLPVGRSIAAIIAGYLGLFGLVIPGAGFFAVLFGIGALVEIKRNPEKLGKPRAWFGIVLGAASTALWGSILVVGILDRRH